jgi:PIN domain nuclease of toxin-antitoxin system
VRVVADSHAVVWHSQRSERLSEIAAATLNEAENTDGVVVSVASLIDLWYVTQTTAKVTDADLAELRDKIASASGWSLQPIDLDVIDATTSIPRDLLGDPWDRFIVATARALNVALVTRDGPIRDSGLVPTIW